MKLDQFISELRDELLKDDEVYAHSKYGSIRILTKEPNGPMYCPVTYLCEKKTGKRFVPVDFLAAGEILGLKETRVVVHTADCDTGSRLYNPGLHQELMLIVRKKQEQPE